MKSRFIMIYLLVFAAALLFNSLKITVPPAIKPLAQLPQAFGEWRMINQDVFSAAVIDVLKPTDYLSRAYSNGRGDIVRLYIGYHDGSVNSGPIHSPKHCLPGSGWNSVSEEKLQTESGHAKLNLLQGVYQKGGDQELFLYWFQLKGKSVINEFDLKLTQLYNSIVYKRRDAAFVRISVPVKGDKNASSKTALKFVVDFFPFFTEIMTL